MAYSYDMIVIGGGAAGLTAAGMSALLGAKTMLIEAKRLGGDCTWSGCIPSKTIIHAAKIAHDARIADRYGLEPGYPPLPFSRVMEMVHNTRRHIYEEFDAPPNLEKLGVEIVSGRASFTDPHTIEIATATGQATRATSRYFVIAAGSRPSTPNFPVPVLTNESLFEITALPRRLVIIGAGPAGIEMSQAFGRLGSQVTVVGATPRILPKDDPEVTAILAATLRAEGIELVLGHKAASAERSGEELRVILDDARRIRCDAILAAIGRQPNIEELRLERAGVRFRPKGIIIDAHCRTSAAHIYAAGDVTGKYQFTHMAEHMSKVAVTNALLRFPRSVDARHIVWCTFTGPELARLGKSEDDLKRQGAKYTAYRFPFRKIDRAITAHEASGLIKVLANASGRILGATILGANAGEMICEWALAMRSGLKLRNVADTIHPYPTYLLDNRRAADQWYLQKLGSPLLGVLGKILGYRGERRQPAEI